jgi:hypothetical protein
LPILSIITVIQPIVSREGIFGGSELYNSRFDLGIENNRSKKEE